MINDDLYQDIKIRICDLLQQQNNVNFLINYQNTNPLINKVSSKNINSCENNNYTIEFKDSMNKKFSPFYQLNKLLLVDSNNLETNDIFFKNIQIIILQEFNVMIS